MPVLVRLAVAVEEAVLVAVIVDVDVGLFVGVLVLVTVMVDVGLFVGVEPEGVGVGVWKPVNSNRT